jgi:hypothetical protein
MYSLNFDCDLSPIRIEGYSVSSRNSVRATHDRSKYYNGDRLVPSLKLAICEVMERRDGPETWLALEERALQK